MKSFLTENELLTKVLTKEEVLRCRMDDYDQGYILDGIELDKLIVDYYTGGENYIKTECGHLMKILNAGWILVPEINGELDWLHYERLDEFLEKNGVQIKDKKRLDDSLIVYKQRIAMEYIHNLEKRIEGLNEILQNQSHVDLDLLVLIIKDYRTQNTKSLVHLKEQMEQELKAWKYYINKCVDNKEWDFDKLIYRYLEDALVNQ